MAQTSERLFAATVRPKIRGSFTMGWKKSSVWTSASSGVMHMTPASSIVSMLTSRSGLRILGSFSRMPARLAGAL